MPVNLNQYRVTGYLIITGLFVKTLIQIYSIVSYIQAGIYMFRFNKRNTRTRSEVCSHLVIVFLSLTLSM